MSLPFGKVQALKGPDWQLDVCLYAQPPTNFIFAHNKFGTGYDRIQCGWEGTSGRMQIC